MNMPKLNTTINLTSIFERYVVRFGCENQHQEDMCSKKRVESLHAILNMIGGPT